MSFIRDTAKAVRRKAPLAGGVALAQFMGAVFLALGTRFITEFVDPSTFGSYKLVIGLITFVSGLLLMPLIRFAMRAIHDAAGSMESSLFVGTARRSIGIVSVAGGALCLLPIMALDIVGVDSDVLGWAAAGVALLVVQAQVNLEAALLTSTGRPALASAFSAGSTALLPAALVGAFVVRADVVSLIAAHAVVFALMLFWIRRTNGAASPGSVREWLLRSRRFALPLIPVAVLTWLFSVGDRYLLAWLSDFDTVGRYAAVYGLVAAPLGVMGGLIPSISYEPAFRSASKRDRAASRSLIRRTVGAQIALIAIAVLAIVALAPLAVNLLLAESYRDGARSLMPWIALGQGALVATYGLDLAAYANKRTSTMAFSHGAAVVVNLTANLVLIPRRGALGAAQATALAGLVYLIVMWWLQFPALRISAGSDDGQ